MSIDARMTENVVDKSFADGQQLLFHIETTHNDLILETRPILWRISRLLQLADYKTPHGIDDNVSNWSTDHECRSLHESPKSDAIKEGIRLALEMDRSQGVPQSQFMDPNSLDYYGWSYILDPIGNPVDRKDLAPLRKALHALHSSALKPFTDWHKVELNHAYDSKDGIYKQTNAGFTTVVNLKDGILIFKESRRPALQPSSKKGFFSRPKEEPSQRVLLWHLSDVLYLGLLMAGKDLMTEEAKITYPKTRGRELERRALEMGLQQVKRTQHVFVDDIKDKELTYTLSLIVHNQDGDCLGLFIEKVCHPHDPCGLSWQEY